MAPIIVLVAAIRRRKVESGVGRSKLKRRRRGVSFCHVRRIVAEGHLREAIVDGNHWNIGAIPALVIRAIRRKIGVSLSHWDNQIEGARRKRVEPVACARKYLHAELVLSDEGLVG